MTFLRVFPATSSVATTSSDLDHYHRDCKQPFNAHIIARALVQLVLCPVFAAEPFAQHDPIARRRRNHAKNLVCVSCTECLGGNSDSEVPTSGL
jgi:hypothetical protein